MYRLGCILALVLLADISTCRAGFISLTPEQTGQLTQSPGGGGNQSGLFAGQSGGVGLRRGLLQFDVAHAGLPAGATITSATLTMTLLSSGGGPANTVNIGLHDVTTAWTPAATWTSPWTTPGGNFSSTASATLAVNRVSGTPANNIYTWGSTPQMVQDVQNWLNHPSQNFGWLVQGNESQSMSVRRFSLDPNSAPTLNIQYTVHTVPVPSNLVLMGTGAVTMLLGFWRTRSSKGRSLTPA